MRQRSCAHLDFGASDPTGRLIRTRGGRRRARVNRQGAASSRKRNKQMATVTNLPEIRKDRLHVLTNMLAHARIFVPGDLALYTEWRSKTHAAIEVAASESGLTAEEGLSLDMAERIEKLFLPVEKPTLPRRRP